MEYLKHLYTGTLSSGYREDTIEQNFLDVIRHRVESRSGSPYSPDSHDESELFSAICYNKL